MVCGLQFVFGLVDELEGAAALSLLEEQPALVDFSAGDEARRVGGLSRFTRGGDVLEREFVFPFFAMGAAFPEMGDKAEMRGEDAVSRAEDGFERSYRIIDIFRREALESFGEFPFEGIDEAEVCDVCLREAGAALFKKGEVTVAEVDPLRETEQERDGLRLAGREAGGDVGMGVEQGKASLDVSLEDGLFELIQKGRTGRVGGHGGQTGKYI